VSIAFAPALCHLTGRCATAAADSARRQRLYRRLRHPDEDNWPAVERIADALSTRDLVAEEENDALLVGGLARNPAFELVSRRRPPVHP
jgi:hypothetical protein